jgi:hypothetical protein
MLHRRNNPLSQPPPEKSWPTMLSRNKRISEEDQTKMRTL